ncbi:hypothetical protein OEIGOIKO_07296 [Streptomyces chrestomyceticus JCM 4735]|uniref:Uncharacterized protein n=1 Tax=Streptomyces chrestomyceticus JCM 4735 TaxID=1306181 RepID=A0A7U9L323_9ACTN|nr:hypothetical protein [Streptomyces chrestomyceticus]GCD39463.1 hypothetical protein OEIGOIKO_07296 [Streptomyces chrestomyceticus JCM 4735]
MSETSPHFGDRIFQVGDGNAGKVQGPVTYGNVVGSQLAWGDGAENTARKDGRKVAPEFAALVEAVADTLRLLPSLAVPEEALDDAAAIEAAILDEASRDQPDRGAVRRAVAALKGILAPVAVGAVTAGAAAGADETARVLIERLGGAF